ncbi:MAG: hypothetical protein A4E43_01309 [Methanosaeta sp. PtaB.Bin005]|nr:MAG: hypothetical protein A4E43_01309 [Methanosaeta sp. PtaB.Bin005]
MLTFLPITLVTVPVRLSMPTRIPGTGLSSLNLFNGTSSIFLGSCRPKAFSGSISTLPE